MEKDFEEIYYTITGSEKIHGGVPWVEDASADGTDYDRAYQAIWDARESLCRRFGLEREDKDLETIMDAVLVIEQDIGKRLFYAGVEYARRGYRL